MMQPFHRQSEIQRLKTDLIKGGYPRAQMFLLVSIAGGVGFLSSFGMLRYGLTLMMVRYPIAVAFSYLALILLLWLWLRTSSDDYSNIDFPSDIPLPCGKSCSSGCHDVSHVENGGDGVSDVIGAVGHADEFAVPIFVGLFVLCIFLSSLWIIYTAPTLFAELLVDGVLSASLYRKLRGLETQHWVISAIGRTIWPFVITAVVMCVIGAGLNAYTPGSTTLAEAIRQHVQ